MKSKFLKIAGVSSEKEFYKKFPTEESFFAAHPEAREMKKGGSMEAFPQTITADNFFSYGVPAPPNYLQKGGANNQAVPSSTYVNIPVPKLYSERPQPNPGEYTTIAFPDPDAFPGDSIRYFVGNQTPSGGTPYMRDLGNLFGVSDKTPRDIYKYLENPNLPEGRLYEDTLRIQANRNPNSIAYPLLGFEKKNKGGSLTNVPVFPQAQTEKQFFIPIYTNSPNAYAYGGMPEVFPQVGPVDYQPPVNMPLFMDQGGTATPPADYPVSKGVNNTTGNFVSWLRNKSYSASEKEATKNAMGMMKNGGRTLPYMEPVRTVADNGTNVTTTGYTQDDFNKFFNPAMDAWVQSYMSKQQPNYGYAGYNDMRGFIPSMYAYNYDPRYKFTARNAQGLMGRGTSNMPLIHAMLPELYSGNKSYDELMKDPNFKNRISTLGLTSYSERPRGLFGKRTERTYTFGVPQEYNLNGQTGTGKLTVDSNASLNNPSLSSTPPAQSNALPGPVTTPPADQGQFWKNWIPTLNQSAQSNAPGVSTTSSTPNASDLIQPGDYDPRVKQAYDANFRPGQGPFSPSGGWQEYPGTMEKTPVGPLNRHGGLHKAQGGFSFSPDDEAGDAPVNPIGVTPSTGLTEQQMRTVLNDDSFGIKTTGKENLTITEKEKGPLSGMFSDFNTNQAYKRFLTNALNSRNQPDTFLLEDTITGIKPAMNFGQDPLSRKQMAENFGNSAIQQDRGLYGKFGGQYSVGDEVEMTQEELNEFIQNGGQVDFI